MRYLTIVASVVGVLLAPWAGAGELSVYTLVKGNDWHGARLGGAPLTSLDSICRESVCYRFNKFDAVIQARLKRFGVQDGHFDTLASLPGAERQGKRLILPYEFGRDLYLTAESRYLIHHRRRR